MLDACPDWATPRQPGVWLQVARESDGWVSVTISGAAAGVQHTKAWLEARCHAEHDRATGMPQPYRTLALTLALARILPLTLSPALDTRHSTLSRH